MSGFLRLGEMSSLALHAMAILASNAGSDPSGRVSVVEMAARLESSRHTLHKVMTRLVAAKLVDSARGPMGGAKLALSAAHITVLMIVEAVEGKIASNGCMFSKRVCPPGKPCAFPGFTCGLENRIRGYFQNTSLAALMAQPGDDALLEEDACLSLKEK